MPASACALALSVLVAAPALANDGFGGLSATGLTFSRTDAVVMESEDLFIGLEKISVDYVFRNTTGEDVTGEVIFPLPPISLWAQLESDQNLPRPVEGNILTFRALVDGAEVPVSVDAIAVIEPPWEENRPLSEQYDTPGRDVTAELVRLGIPLSADVDRVSAVLSALPPATRDELTRLDLAEFQEASDGMPAQAYPHWSVILRYHWTQTFPAGATVRIHHDYDNRPPGGLFNWEDPPPDYQRQLVDQYCIDGGTSRAIARTVARPGEDFSMGVAYNLSYVLRTANSWAGPIGNFRLTLDKGDPANVISLCIDGISKTGPTTFVSEKTNYTPERDLEILVVTPFKG